MIVGDLHVSFQPDGSIDVSLKASDTADGIEEWHLIGVELRSGMPNTARLYLDGVLQDPTQAGSSDRLTRPPGGIS